MLHILAQYSSQGANNAQQAAPFVFAGASFICIGLVWLVMLVVSVFIFGTIFKKAGYNFWLGLLMILPLVNLIWLIVFAFSTWPIHQELQSLRGRAGGYAGGGFPVTPPQPPGQ